MQCRCHCHVANLIFVHNLKWSKLLSFRSMLKAISYENINILYRVLQFALSLTIMSKEKHLIERQRSISAGFKELFIKINSEL